jgi:hypothetical protein
MVAKVKTVLSTPNKIKVTNSNSTIKADLLSISRDRNQIINRTNLMEVASEARASINSSIMVAVNNNSRARIKATTKATPVVMAVVVLKEVASNKETMEVTSRETKASVPSTTIRVNISKIAVEVVTSKIHEDVVEVVQVASPVHR